jgi:hypothetical protein
LHSVRFAEKEPPIQWDVPAGWTAATSPPGRFATFQLGSGNEALEVRVSALGRQAGALLANVNRWRREDLKLGPMSESDLGKVVKEVKVGGVAAKLVDLTNAGMDDSAEESAARPGMKYDKPDGWRQVPPNRGFGEIIAFQVGEGDRTAKVTLSSAGGSLLANVNRWRSMQLGLPAVDEAAMEKDLHEFDLGGFPARYADLEGRPPAGGQRERILAILIPQGQEGWVIFKMKGPADLVGQQKAAFEAFVKSVRKDEATGGNDG